MSPQPLATYRNPFWPEDFPDPFVFKVRGRYYAYATEHETYPSEGSWVFPILTSIDLVAWREVGKAMPALGSPYNRYWAPEVAEYNGKFYLYYAVHTSEFAGSIRVAVADHPAGPFSDSRHDLTAHLFPWAIDPHVFRDQDGERYLYMTIEYRDSSSGFEGSGNAVDRLVDPFTLSGHPARVTPPRHSWQLFERNRKERGGVDWYTVEGPSVIQHRHRYYETFSGGCYYRDNYAVSYAVSDTPMGSGGMHDSSWVDWQGANGESLLVRGDNHFISPGHNSLVVGPNNADLYIVYHAWQQDRTSRRPCLDRLFWHGDALCTAAPTHTLQPAPVLPHLQELFEEAVLNPCWSQQGGEWQPSQGEVIQERIDSLSLLYQQLPLSRTSLIEINLRYISGPGYYGIAFASDKGSEVYMALTADRRLELRSSTKEGAIASAPLPANLDLSAWHQLLLSLSGSVLTIHLDGTALLEMVLSVEARTFALFTRHCSAAFSGITLTDHFRDELLDDRFSLEQLGWHEPSDSSISSSWLQQHDRLAQSKSAGIHILLKGEISSAFEFGASVCIEQNANQAPAAGLVCWQSTEEPIYVWLTTLENGWHIVVESNGTSQSISSLPPSFQPTAWHTLRLLYHGEQLAIYLDGLHTQTIPLKLSTGETGIATRHTAASFTGVWKTDFLASGER